MVGVVGIVNSNKVWQCCIWPGIEGPPIAEETVAITRQTHFNELPTPLERRHVSIGGSPPALQSTVSLDASWREGLGLANARVM